MGQQDSRVTGDGTMLPWPAYNFILILCKQWIQENHTHALKHTVARRLKVTCTVEGRKPYTLRSWIGSKSLDSHNSTLCFLQFEVFPLVSWLPYRGSGSLHKAWGGWGICILWRNWNSIFCSVTCQSAYSVRPCIKLSFFVCFYSQPFCKKIK